MIVRYARMHDTISHDTSEVAQPPTKDRTTAQAITPRLTCGKTQVQSVESRATERNFRIHQRVNERVAKRMSPEIGRNQQLVTEELSKRAKKYQNSGISAWMLTRVDAAKKRGLAGLCSIADSGRIIVLFFLFFESLFLICFLLLFFLGTVGRFS